MSRSVNKEGSRLLSSSEPVYTRRALMFLPAALAALIARIKGAIFMKLGRAPAIIVIFISF